MESDASDGTMNLKCNLNALRCRSYLFLEITIYIALLPSVFRTRLVSCRFRCYGFQIIAWVNSLTYKEFLHHPVNDNNTLSEEANLKGRLHFCYDLISPFLLA